MAPGIGHDLVPPGVEAEWVSDAGEVKEAVLWSPDLSTTDRRATVIGEGGLATLTQEDDPGAEVRPVGDYLYEPDGAVIRAGLVTAVPLLLFSEGARRLRFSTVGFLQYLAPTGQFLLAVLVYGEELSPAKLLSFALIWVGLVLYSIEARRSARIASRY